MEAGPDVSCRIAWADDAAAIAAVQVRAWRTQFADVLPDEVLAAMDPTEVAEQWRTSLARPTDARQRVLVALTRNTVHGFALTSPATDPDLDPVRDGELAEVTVDPEQRGQGHGSRLLQACVDTLKADRFARGVVWLNSTDDTLRGFLTDAGFAPDGAHRELDLRGDGEVRVKQVRLHVSLD